MKPSLVMAAVLTVVSLATASPKVSAATTNTNNKLAAIGQIAAKPDSKPAAVIVTVQSGDSLSSIADVHQTTWVRIYNANTQIDNPDLINPGDQLRIPSADEQLSDRPIPSNAPVMTAATTTSTYTTAQATPVVPNAPVTDGGSAKAYIYSKESGNNPNATNPNGCYGIGQDCNGVVRSQCGADYACQDEYFTSYATRRYGSWDGALAFWQANGWW